MDGDIFFVEVKKAVYWSGTVTFAQSDRLEGMGVALRQGFNRYDTKTNASGRFELKAVPGMWEAILWFVENDSNSFLTVNNPYPSLNP